MLINKYYGAKKILKQWIEENKPTYFSDMKIVIDQFSHSIVANYFLEMNSNKIYFLYENNLYCFNKIILENSCNELHDKLEEIIINFKQYN